MDRVSGFAMEGEYCDAGSDALCRAIPTYDPHAFRSLVIAFEERELGHVNKCLDASLAIHRQRRVNIHMAL